MKSENYIIRFISSVGSSVRLLTERSSVRPRHEPLYGILPERSKGADLRSAGFGRVGSNPTDTITKTSNSK